MEVEEDTFQTPANRRSPANYANKRGKGEESGLVTNAFESLRPYISGSLDSKGKWLEDELCLHAHNELGLVMPPIGYEADARKFNSMLISEDGDGVVSRHDIYQESVPLDQGTISSFVDEEVAPKSHLNEFGFGYRNGYVYNKKNVHSKESLLYITHKHSKQVDLNSYLENSNNNYNSPKKRLVGALGMVGHSPRASFSPRASKSVKSAKSARSAMSAMSAMSAKSLKSPRGYLSAHERAERAHGSHAVDKVVDVMGGQQNGTNSRKASSAGDVAAKTRQRRERESTRRPSIIETDASYDEDLEMDTATGLNINDSFENGEDTRFSFSSGKIGYDPLGWMEKFEDLSKDGVSNSAQKANSRRESFVSEYSNFTPGQPRQRKRLDLNSE